MTRKKLLTIVSILLVIAVVIIVGGYFYLTNTKETPSSPVVGGSGSLAEGGLNDQSATTTASSTASTTIPRLRHITTTPIAGADFVKTKDGYEIWFADRGNGNISTTSTSSLDITRITNTTIPKVYEAYFGNEGNGIIFRTLNQSGIIQTFLGSIESSSTDLTGILTGDTISALSLSPDKTKFFGMTGDQSGIGNIYTFGGKYTNIFTHPLKKWIPQWVNNSTILMTSAPSAKTQNIAYFLNPTNKSFVKVLGPENGLVALSSPDASNILYSDNTNDSLVFDVYDVKKGTSISLNTATIPDKCVWSNESTDVAYCGFPKDTSGIFPDDWYQGKVQFDDVIESIDVNTFQYKVYSDLRADSGQPIDAIDLRLSPDDKYLLFTNKRDLTLWMLELQ